MIGRSLLLLIVLSFYVWVGGLGANSFNLKQAEYFRGGYISYNHLADALLSGKLSLLVEPDPKLLAIPDPYEVRRYNWQDASLYKGKYYFYWGVVPAIFLYVPYRFITGYHLSDVYAVLFFMFGGFIWTVALMKHLRSKYFLETPEWMFLLAVAVLGFGNLGGFTLRHSGVYQVAISSGFFFLTGAIYFLCKAIAYQTSVLTLWMLGFAGLFLGLAIGSEPNLLLAAMAVIIISVIRLNRSSINSQWKFLSNREILALVVPFIICIFTLAAYNYLRFEDIFEFGIKYQLGIGNFKRHGFFNSNNILSNSFLYLFQDLKTSLEFPYFSFSSIAAIPPSITSRGPIYYVDGVAGIFPAVPFVLLILIYPLANQMFFSKDINLKSDKNFPYFEFQIISVAAFINFVALLAACSVSMRYSVDYIYLFIVLAIIFWFYFDSKFDPGTGIKQLLRALTVSLAMYSILVGFCIGFTGPDNELERQDPQKCNQIKSWFKPFSDFLSGVCKKS